MSRSSSHEEEDSNDADKKQAQRASTGCYQFFGIKSHLHHFYDYKTADGEDTVGLLRPTKKSKRCSPVMWKILLWFGINSLVFGAILILVSHFTTRHQVLHSATADKRFAVVDKRAARINTALDILGTVGIISFCSAGVLIVVAVLLPTYFNKYCFEDRDIPSESETYSRLNSEDESSIERVIPATQHIEGVQPKRRDSEMAINTDYVPIE